MKTTQNTVKIFILYPLSVFVVISALITTLWAMGIDPDQWWVWTVAMGIVIAMIILLASLAAPPTVRDGITLGIAWFIVFLIADLLTIPFLGGWEYFLDWRAYIHYPVPIILVPLVAKYRSK